MSLKDFDRFMAEREGREKRLRILGREIAVPVELPWWYVMKVERMLKEGGSISGEENIALLRQLMKPEDYRYVTEHREFRASWFWEIIAFGWLRDDAGDDAEGPRFRAEDDAAGEARESKKDLSAPSSCGRTLRLTSNGSTAST